MFLSCFFHFSFILLSFFFHLSFILLSSSFIVFPFFHFCFFLFFFLLCSKSFFLPRLPHDFQLKLLCKKINFLGRLGRYPIGPFLFFSCLFFFFFFFFFFWFFNFIQMFFSFFFFICVSFFILYSFLFLLLSFKSFFLFYFVSLLSFLGCSKSLAALQDSLVKSGHSELALFALYWLVVTLPCGIVHILVMIRLRVVYGGRRVGQVLPSYQNRQISALDSPVSSLFISVL